MKSCLLLIILVFSFPVFGQSKKTIRKATQSTVKRAFSDAPFDLNAEKLPPAFAGTRFAEIFAELTKLKNKFKKDEYETTAQYDARLAALADSSLYGKIKLSSLVGYVLPPGAIETLYNADTQTLNLFLPLQSDGSAECYVRPERISEYECIAFTLIEDLKSSSRYVGRNAFGLKKVITKQEFVELGIIFSGLQSLKPPAKKNYDRGYAADLRVEPNKARTLRSSVRAILIGNFASPYAVAESRHDTPTMAEPLDITTTFLRVALQLKEVCFFDDSTGEILAKIHD